MQYIPTVSFLLQAASHIYYAFLKTHPTEMVSTLAIDPTGSLNGTGTKDQVVNSYVMHTAGKHA
jgi:hypothetical protein